MRFGRETSLLVLELRQEGGRGIHINMEGRGDQAQFELGATFDLPPFSPTDPEAAEQLAAAIADQPPGALLLALPREESVLRRLELPTTESDELPTVARFRLLQEAQLDEAGAAVDCLPIQTHEATTTAIVVGANGTIMAFGNALATASGRKLAGVSLRVLGLPDLLDTPGSAPTLAIDLTRGPSLAIVVDGVVHRVGAASDDLEDVERETIRLVSAWRMTEDSPVEEIVVSGQQELADHLVGRLRSALGLSVHSVVAPLDTDLGEDVDHPSGTPWGLVGLGRAHLLSHERIDLQHPRVPEDRAAPLKRRGVLLAGVILVLFGWIWSSGNKEVRQLQAQIDLLRAELSQQTQAEGEALRNLFRYRHAVEWLSVAPDFVSELQAISDVVPDDGQAVMGSWRGFLAFDGVVYDNKASNKEKWKSPYQLRFVMTGETKDRTVADAIRAALVEGDRYRIETTGAETAKGKRLPRAFTYELGREGGR